MASASKTIFVQFTKAASIHLGICEKRWMTIKKISFRNWKLIQNFFIAYLLILVRCKTKGADGAVCALLCN
jgi:hypothetical protein